MDSSHTEKVREERGREERDGKGEGERRMEERGERLAPLKLRTETGEGEGGKIIHCRYL